ncbi:MAG: hypothetical protein R3C25_03435 [Hyphomonadaceae bacterium]
MNAVSNFLWRSLGGVTGVAALITLASGVGWVSHAAHLFAR